MAIRRTKEQKQKTLQKRQIALQYSYKAPASSSARAESQSVVQAQIPVPAKVHQTSRDLFQYDVRLIFRDLIKTFFITGFILLILVGITWYLKR